MPGCASTYQASCTTGTECTHAELHYISAFLLKAVMAVASAGEYELDEDDKALFELDVSGDKENGGAMQPSIRKSAGTLTSHELVSHCILVGCT